MEKKKVNPAPKMRTSYILDRDVQKKIRYIALMDDRDITQVVNDALTVAINTWEKKNGKIAIK